MPSPSLTGFEHKVVVGVGDMAISNNPDLTLVTYSLGSCLGIAIFDPVSRVGGLLHVMLPDSTIDPVKASARPGMFIDTGVPALFRAAYELRADKRRIQIYVVGGAQIMDNSGFFNIGKRNCEALESLFRQHQLPVVGQQVGGLHNRTMFLRLHSGQVTLKMSGQQTEVPL